jgi:hypothetical protein
LFCAPPARAAPRPRRPAHCALRCAMGRNCCVRYKQSLQSAQYMHDSSCARLSSIGKNNPNTFFLYKLDETTILYSGLAPSPPTPGPRGPRAHCTRDSAAQPLVSGSARPQRTHGPAIGTSGAVPAAGHAGGGAVTRHGPPPPCALTSSRARSTWPLGPGGGAGAALCRAAGAVSRGARAYLRQRPEARWCVRDAYAAARWRIDVPRSLSR